MSESQEIVRDNQKSSQKEVNHANQKNDVIGALFEERDRLPSESRGVPESGVETKREKPSLREEPAQGEEGRTPSKEEGKDAVEDDEDSSLTRLQMDLEKTRKLMKETQRWGHQNSKKVREASRSVKALVDSGSLTEDEAQGILSVLQSEVEEDDEIQAPAVQNPFASLFQVANRELENIRKYSEDDLLQDKIEAFDFLLSVSSKEEVSDIFETLADLEDNPVKLTRKMIALGQEAYEDSYRAIKEAGGIKDYLSSQNNQIEKLQKKIDKLEKKLSQYEDYDKPNYRIAGTADINEKSAHRDTISALFAERDRPRQVAR
jgi:hypothetical protein